MGGCSGGGSSDFNLGAFNEGSGSEIEELIKSFSIEEANSLIKEGCVPVAVYWNSVRASEEYILGRVKKKSVPAKKVGFSMP